MNSEGEPCEIVIRRRFAEATAPPDITWMIIETSYVHHILHSFMDPGVVFDTRSSK